LRANPTSSSASTGRRWARVAISFPKGRQHHVAMAALEQRYPQPCLELLDPSAQRRLRDGTTFRSTTEMALLGQRTQKAELLKTG